MTDERNNEEVRAARGLLDSLTDEANVVEQKRLDPDEAHTFVYQPPEAAKIPDEIKNRFASEGYVLGWAAWKDPDGKFKTDKIRLLMQEGYTFVTPEEAPEMKVSFGVGQDIHGSMIVNGDLALMKIPEYKRAAKKKFFVDQAKAREGAHIREAQGTSNRFAQVLDESKRNLQKIENFAPNQFKGD